jgi:Mn-dependent DtxR family transcriptional regulator
MALQESGEMYLETILILSQQKGAVRSVDISEYMGYSKPSVSRAVGLLKSGNYIVMEEDGHIALTPAGRQIAEKIMARHTLLTDLLISLGVSRETAAEDACKMEHVISDETFGAIQNHIEKHKTNQT